MRSRLAARSPRATRLALATVAVAALTAGLSACDAGANADASTGASSSPSSEKDNSAAAAQEKGSGDTDAKGSDTTSAKGDTVDAAAQQKNTGGTGGSGSQASNSTSDKDTDVDAVKQDYYAKKCDNGDLTFTLKSESQAGGYFLITAKARPGVVCLLQGAPQQVMFGSDPDTLASRAEKTAGATIKLKGSTVAYLGVNPHSTNSNDGKIFELLIVSVSDDGESAGELKVPGSVPIDKPLVTNWHANSADVVTPFL